jgi:hypothetical protein
MSNVELIVYDNDGPEGYFERLKFERSHQAVDYIITHYKPDPNFQDLNFEIKNNYKR